MDCEDENLHPSRFVNMSADVYTEAQVLEYTEVCEMYCISSFFLPVRNSVLLFLKKCIQQMFSGL